MSRSMSVSCWTNMSTNKIYHIHWSFTTITTLSSCSTQIVLYSSSVCIHLHFAADCTRWQEERWEGRWGASWGRSRRSSCWDACCRSDSRCTTAQTQNTSELKMNCKTKNKLHKRRTNETLLISANSMVRMKPWRKTMGMRKWSMASGTAAVS